MTVLQQILAVGLRLVYAELSDGTSGNISVRSDDGATILITPSSRNYHLLAERDLVRVHLGTGRAEGRWPPSSEWRLHARIYEARPEVNAVIHHHGTWSSAVAVARRTIPVLIDEAADIGPIPTAPYAPSASEELAEVASEQLARQSNAVLLANHGAVVVGRDLSEALRRALEVERLAKIYSIAELLGGAKSLDEAAIARSRRFFDKYRTRQHEMQEIPAMLLPRITGPVSVADLVTYSFQAGTTFASLLQDLILRKLHKSKRAA
jgi:L-ribulose-5-phosphate 4-epimerase